MKWKEEEEKIEKTKKRRREGKKSEKRKIIKKRRKEDKSRRKKVKKKNKKNEEKDEERMEVKWRQKEGVKRVTLQNHWIKSDNICAFWSLRLYEKQKQNNGKDSWKQRRKQDRSNWRNIIIKEQKKKVCKQAGKEGRRKKW